MKTTSILVSEFINVMNTITSCQFCSLSYTTDTDHTNKKLAGGQKNPYYNRLSCVTDCTGLQFNASYENAVNNRLAKGDGNAHKGATYLRLYTTKATEKNVTYILDGKVVTDTKEIENIKAAFRPSSSSNRQTAAGIDEKDQVKPFTLNVADVHHISINRQKLVIIH